MTVLNTFLESLLNFLFNIVKNTTKFGIVREKAVSKFELPETQFEKTVVEQIACNTHLE